MAVEDRHRRFVVGDKDEREVLRLVIRRDREEIHWIARHCHTCSLADPIPGNKLAKGEVFQALVSPRIPEFEGGDLRDIVFSQVSGDQDDETDEINKPINR